MNIIEKKQLNNSCNSFYDYMFFYNSCYYFLNNNNRYLDIYNCKLHKISDKLICEKYNGIIKSTCNNKFYGFKKNINNEIYVLNDDFLEIDKIIIKAPKEYLHPIVSITLDSKKCKIIICTEKNVYSINLQGNFIKNELSTSSYEYISYLKKEEKNYRNLNGCCCKKEFNTTKISISSVIIFCEKLYITYDKNNSIFIAEISENGNIVSSSYIDDNIVVLTVLDVNNNLQLLCSKFGKYNYIYVTDKCCNSFKKLDNYCCVCKNKKEKCCKEHDCIKCEDIVESIALIEFSIAHILNAEGEKIQKALCLTDDICDLVKINDSVSKTINQITMLEQILTEKLETSLKNCNLKNCFKPDNSCCSKYKKL